MVMCNCRNAVRSPTLVLFHVFIFKINDSQLVVVHSLVLYFKHVYAPPTRLSIGSISVVVIFCSWYDSGSLNPTNVN